MIWVVELVVKPKIGGIQKIDQCQDGCFARAVLAKEKTYAFKRNNGSSKATEIMGI